MSKHIEAAAKLINFLDTETSPHAGVLGILRMFVAAFDEHQTALARANKAIEELEECASHQQNELERLARTIDDTPRPRRDVKEMAVPEELRELARCKTLEELTAFLAMVETKEEHAAHMAVLIQAALIGAREHHSKLEVATGNPDFVRWLKELRP